MAGLYSILKTWNENEVLTSDDLNAAVTNEKTNAVASMVEGYSTVNNVANLARIQSTIDPAPGGDPLQSLGNSSVAGEIQKLRFAIKRMLEVDEWYDAPKYLLRFINRRPYFKAACLGSAEWVDNGGRGGGLVSVGATTPVFATSDGKFTNGYLNSSGAGTSAASFSIGQLLEKKLMLGFWIKAFQVNGTVFTHTGLDFYLKTDADGKLVLTLKTSEATSATAKKTYTITSTDALDPGAWTHVMITLDFSGAPGSHFLRMFVDGEETGTGYTAETMYIPVPMMGDIVFYEEIARFDDLPEKLAFDSTTLASLSYSGAGGTNNITNGVLNIAGGTANYYTRNNVVNTVDFIGRLRPGVMSTTNQDGMGGPAIITISDSSNREWHFRMTAFGISVTSGAINTVSEGLVAYIPIDTTVWHHYRFYGSPSAGYAIYIDGRYVISCRGASLQITSLVPAGGSTGSAMGVKFRFGCQDVDSRYSFDFMQMAYDTSNQTALWEASSTGKICEVFAIGDSLATGNDFPTQFLTRSVNDLFGEVQLPHPVFIYGGVNGTGLAKTSDATDIWGNVAVYTPEVFLSSRRRARIFIKSTLSKTSASDDVQYGLALSQSSAVTPARLAAAPGSATQQYMVVNQAHRMTVEECLRLDHRSVTDQKSSDGPYRGVMTVNADGNVNMGYFFNYSIEYLGD